MKQNGYSKLIGSIYIFNLIVGTGSLAIPKSFHDSGYILATIILLFMAFLSFITITYVIEVMSILNFKALVEKFNKGHSDTPGQTDDEIPLIDGNVFEINEKIEMIDMVKKLFGNTIVFIFILNITVYLYGDIAIYSAIVAKIFRNILCNPVPSNETTLLGQFHDSENDSLCWTDSNLSRINVYRLFLVAFTVCVFPTYVFRFNWIQLFATFYRWVSIIIMIVLGAIRISKNSYTDTASLLGDVMPMPHVFAVNGIMSLVGIIIYSFMCHHSLPGLITPIRDSHKRLNRHVLIPVFVQICVLYISLSMTAVFAFEKIEDFYSLNFIPKDVENVSIFMKVISYLLVLYPVITVISNYSILTNTLSSNLIKILRFELKNEGLNKFVYGTIAIIPSILIAMTTSDIEFLISFTGALAGSGIQYIFPVLLVYKARQYIASEQFKEDLSLVKGTSVMEEHQTYNPHRSRFANLFFYTILVLCSIAGLALIMTKKIGQMIQH